MKNPQSIRTLFAFPGFTVSSKLVGVYGDRYARIIRLEEVVHPEVVHPEVVHPEVVHQSQYQKPLWS